MEVQIINEKKSTILVLLESSSFVEFNYLKKIFIKGHWRLLRDTKGQIEFQKMGKTMIWESNWNFQFMTHDNTPGVNIVKILWYLSGKKIFQFLWNVNPCIRHTNTLYKRWWSIVVIVYLWHDFDIVLAIISFWIAD